MNHNTRPNSLHPLRRWIPLAALLLALAPTQLHRALGTQASGGMYFKIAGLSFRSQDYLDGRLATGGSEWQTQHGGIERREYIGLPRIWFARALDLGGHPGPISACVQEDRGEGVQKRRSRYHHNPHPPRRNQLGSGRLGTAPALALAAQSSGGLPSAGGQIPLGLRT